MILLNSLCTEIARRFSESTQSVVFGGNFAQLHVRMFNYSLKSLPSNLSYLRMSVVIS